MAEFSRSALFPFSTKPEAPKRKTAIPPPAATEQPDDGLIRIKGSGAAVINLNHSVSENHSRTVVMETKRTHDEVRVKNPDDPSQYVDVQRPRKVNTQSNEDTRGQRARRDLPGSGGPANITTYYAKQEEYDNVEILRENIEVKNPDWSGGAAP